MKIKTITLFIGAALLAGCNSSDDNSPVNNTKTITFTADVTRNVSPVEQPEKDLVCNIPNLEVLIHDENGDYANTILTNSDGKINTSQIPANHYFTVNPYQSSIDNNGFTRVESIQKELVTVNSTIEINNYADTDSLTNCQVIDQENEAAPITVTLKHIEGLETVPYNNAGDITLYADQPGILLLTRNDDEEGALVNYAFISRENLIDGGVYKFDRNDLLSIDNKVTTSTDAYASSIEVEYLIDGSYYLENYFSLLLPGEKSNSYPSIANQSYTAHHASVEHVLLNGFVYGHQVNTDQNELKLPKLAENAFVQESTDGNIIQYSTNGLKPQLIEIERKYENVEHTVYAAANNNQAAVPSVIKQPELSDFEQYVYITEFKSAGQYAGYWDAMQPVNNAEEIYTQIENADKTFVMPVWEGLDIDLPDFDFPWSRSK